VLDIGCGEGWLVRALVEHGISAIGVDAVPSLVDQAAHAGGGEFHVASYEEIAEGGLDVKVDVVVANFSLIGKESVEGVLRRAPALLERDGSLIIQTLHPLVATGELPYEDGWRHGSWAGFGNDFSDPAPWYFRTLESLEEPDHPKRLRFDRGASAAASYDGKTSVDHLHRLTDEAC